MFIDLYKLFFYKYLFTMYNYECETHSCVLNIMIIRQKKKMMHVKFVYDSFELISRISKCQFGIFRDLLYLVLRISRVRYPRVTHV